MKINRPLSLPGDFHQVDFSARSRVHCMAQRSLSLTEVFSICKSQVSQESICLKADVFEKFVLAIDLYRLPLQLYHKIPLKFCGFVLLESIKLHTVIIVSQCFLAIWLFMLALVVCLASLEDTT